MEETRILIFGASGHGKVIFEILQAMGITTHSFIDDDVSKKSFLSLPVIRQSEIMPDDKVILAIGDNRIRKNIANNITAFPLTALHPSSSVSELSKIGSGSVIMHHAVIQPGTQIGTHCIINTKASVDHDCLIGDFVHISPGATVCGGVKIGELTWVGAGAVIIQDITIGRNVIIGAGAVVIENIPDNVTVVGNPARIIKRPKTNSY